MSKGGTSVESRLVWAFRQALSRPPSTDECTVLFALLERRLSAAKTAPAAVAPLLTVGLHDTPAGLDLIELSAWTAVARTLLNVHETITRY